jgi:hypothetical protein
MIFYSYLCGVEKDCFIFFFAKINLKIKIMLEDEFVPYDEALELKELGFNIPCIGLYEIKSRELAPRTGLTIDWFNDTDDNSHIDSWKMSAPIYSQAFRWFRKKHNKSHRIYEADGADGNVWCFRLLGVGEFLFYYQDSSEYKTYEEAEIECIKKLIDIVK